MDRQADAHRLKRNAEPALIDVTAAPPIHPDAAFTGIVTDKVLAVIWPSGPVHPRTPKRYSQRQHDPLASIKIGRSRFYDLSTVRDWILRRQQRPPGEVKLGRRPGKRRNY